MSDPARDRIVTEAARLRQEHGYSWPDAFAMAELMQIIPRLFCADDCGAPHKETA